MRVFYRFGYFVAREIIGKGTKRKIFTADINRIRAEIKGAFKF